MLNLFLAVSVDIVYFFNIILFYWFFYMLPSIFPYTHRQCFFHYYLTLLVFLHTPMHLPAHTPTMFFFIIILIILFYFFLHTLMHLPAHTDNVFFYIPIVLTSCHLSSQRLPVLSLAFFFLA